MLLSFPFTVITSIFDCSEIVTSEESNFLPVVTEGTLAISIVLAEFLSTLFLPPWILMDVLRSIEKLLEALTEVP